MSPLRWGIISSGKISFDFACAFAALPASEHKLVAISARSVADAEKFAKEFGIPKVYESYEKLVKDSEIDVVYIGSVNPQHVILGKLALNNGKHVLCEKPMGINSREVKELVDLAKVKGLFLMEGLWSRFFPAYGRLKEEIQKGTVGDILQVFVSFGVPISEVDRIKFKELGGGGILDIGIYCVQFASFVFGGEKPTKILTGGHLNKYGVDESTSTTLTFSGGRTATIITHTRTTMPNEAYAVGTKGTIKLENPFWCTTKMTILEDKVELPIHKGKKETNFFNSMGLSYQCHEVRRCINAGLIESPLVSHAESLLISQIMEEMRKQVGVVYPQDTP